MTDQRNTFLIVLSFLVIYIVWGSTYLFLAFVVEVIPPFFASFIRYGSAALILLALSLAFKQFKDVDYKKVKNSFLAGLLMLGIGAGLTSWVLQYLDSGFTALLISAQPLIVVFMMWFDSGKRPASQIFMGVALGIIGIYLLVSQNEIVAHRDQWMAILVLVLCLIAWGIGSIFISKADMPKSFLVNTFIQFTAGASLTFVFSLFSENIAEIDFMSIERTIYFYLIYLSIFGSVIAFLAFTYLLRNVSPDKVSTSTYVNPVIAVLLGWWFRDELLTTQTIIAAAIMLTGVFLINFKLASLKRGLYIRLPKRKKL